MSDVSTRKRARFEVSKNSIDPQRLINAVKDNDSQFLDHLLNGGGDVNTKITDNSSLLMLAIKNRCFETFKCLVDHGADLDIRGYKERTPLMMAAKIGNSEMVNYLIDHGANRNLKRLGTSGNTFLVYAIYAGSLDIIMRYLPTEFSTDYGHRLLKIAIKCNNKKILQYLIEKDAKVKKEDLLNILLLK